MNKYTSEVSIQILISLLKKHSVKYIVASPGTTNISFVASIQNDAFFNVYSCVDERSAAYLACGISAEKNEPVVIICTGATASREYLAGLTEAYYRKLPIIAITASQHLGRIGNNFPQVLDRSVQIKDTIKKSIQLLPANSEEDRWDCNTKINDVLLECIRHGGGPVHINMVTTYSNIFDCNELPNERKISRFFYNSEFPKIDAKRIAIFIGNHKLFSNKEEKIIEEFCEKYNAFVICDHTSNYNGKYKIIGNSVITQSNSKVDNIKQLDLIIDLGNITGASRALKPKYVWRVNPDGEIRDTFKKLTNVFEMEEITFFENYNSLKEDKTDLSNYKEILDYSQMSYNKIDDDKLPFSNVWMAKNMITKLKDGDIVHLAIYNTLRSWDYFNIEKNIKFYSNTGGFGIDGITSTAIGASLVNKHKIYCILGDLAFFYDLNSLGNHHIKNNLRILLINNGTGTEFHNYNHRAVRITKELNEDFSLFAADGHFGNKSRKLVKHYSEDLGFKYMTASNKKEFLDNIDRFMSDDINQSIVFEVFTNSNDESDAIYYMNTLNFSAKSNAKNKIKSLLGEKNISKIKKLLK